VKRYIVFAYDYYEPRGGGRDFVAAFDTLTEAAEYAEAVPNNPTVWVMHIADAEANFEIVWSTD
jgi:hypothetical protein